MKNHCLLLLTFLVPLVLASCKIQSFDKRTGKGGAVLDTSFVFIERTPNRTEAVVRFRTKVPANCHIRYWSDDPQSGGKDNAVEQKCQNNQPKIEFSEIIKPLSPAALYTVEIAVWGRSGAFDQAEKFTVSEGENAIDKNDLFVARVNLQLRTTEIHRHRLGQTANAEVLTRVIKDDYGCGKNLENAIPYNAAHRIFKVESLSFRGFASGESSPHKVNSSFRRIRFNTIARSSQWEWGFTVLGKSFSFNLEPATVMTNALVTTGETPTEIKDAQLTISPREIVDYQAGDLKVNWTLENQTQSSYIIIQVSNVGMANSISCLFDPKSGSGVIPASLLTNLDKKKHDLFIAVVSYQLDLSNQEQLKPAWLVETTDWKLGTLAVK
jgi:hypothetical protein